MAAARIQVRADSGTSMNMASDLNEDTKAKARLEAYRTTYCRVIRLDNYDRELWNNTKILAGNVGKDNKIGTALFSITMPAHYCNYTGNVAGGAIAIALDGLTNCTIALVARQGFWDKSGVSRNLEIEFLRPVKHGVLLHVECEILSIDCKSVVIEGKMYKAGSGSPLAVARQNMVAIRAKL